MPSNTKEAQTACPTERKNAHQAREDLLGSSDVALSEAAAEAVLAHARCEAAAALALPRPIGTQEAILAQVRAIREAVRDAVTLFTEVRRYADASRATASFIGDVELTLAFAQIVSEVSAPTDLEPRDGHAFRAELADAARTLRSQAALTIEQALASTDVATSRDVLCALLALVDDTAECQ